MARTAAALLPALKEVRRRREPRGLRFDVPVLAADGVRIACTLVAGDPDRVVVVTHPAVVGSRYRQVVALADELSRSFSVMLFDFRGHGRSGGRCRLGFSGPALDLAAVVARARGLGFGRVWVAGLSLGAGAAFLAAAGGSRIDALASIGCPPSFPDVQLWRAHPVASRAALRLLGLRVDPGPDDGPSPIDVAPRLDPFPKLMVFGQWEVSPADEIDRFLARIASPSEVITIEGAWHADLRGREAEIHRWFERSM
jgi:pimeloyl-ACP methyl ester carboxylesterase